MHFFFDHTAIIRRMKPIAGTDKYKMSSTATVEVNLQQLDMEAVSKIEGVVGNEYVLFCDLSTNIKIGDRVTDKDTNDEFVVKQIIDADMMGIESFKQVYLTKYNGN